MKNTRREFLSAAAGGALGTVASASGLAAANAGEESRGAKASGLVAKVVPLGGVLKIDINGKVFEPLAFRSFRPEDRNVREFYDAGLRLMSILHTGLNCTLGVPYSKFGEVWIGPRQYDFDAFDRQMELFLKNAPDVGR
jgi:hypothetical protein